MTSIPIEGAYSFRMSSRAPTENAELVREHLAAAHRYYNALVEVERWRRKEIESYWAKRGGYEEQIAKVAALREQARELPKGAERNALYRQADDAQSDVWRLQRETELSASTTPEARRRKERAKELRTEARLRGDKLADAQLAALLDREPDCVAPRDKLRLEIAAEYAAMGKAVSGIVMNQRMRDAGFVSATDDIEQEAKARDYTAYKESGLSFGTRAVVADAFERAVKDAAPEAPSFKRFDEHSVSLGVSFTVQDAFTGHALFNGGNTRVSIERAPDPPGMTPGSRRSGKRAVLRLRIATAPDKSAVWASFPLLLDRREIPPDARVSSVRVSKYRLGVHDQWSVVVGVDLPKPATPRASKAKGVVAVDLTWRRLASGAIRSAYYADEHGVCGSIEVDDRVTSAINKSRDLQEICSRLLHWSSKGDGESLEGGIVVELAAWLQGRDDLPDWLAEVAPHIGKWRSAPRLNRLAEQWASNRFAGDDEIFDAVDKWRRNWRHLYEWAERGRSGALARRLEIFRLAIKPLVERYETIVVRGLKLADMKVRKRADATELVMVDDNVRSIMQLAAPGIFREQLSGIARRRGRHVVSLDDASLPVRCHVCGKSCDWDRAKSLTHACEYCGVEWDQHYNVARNMLALYRERFGSEEKPASARKARKPASKPGSSAKGARERDGAAGRSAD